MPNHVFVDESKDRGLLVCAAVLAPADLARTRTQMRQLVYRGSERVHMTKEKPAQRQTIVNTICTLPVVVDVYDAKSYAPREELKAREHCLKQLVADLALANTARLVIERDDSLEVHDRRVLYREVRVHRLEDQLTYTWMRAKEEPLLWIADAVAWCWAKGGQWRNDVQPVIRNVHQL